MHEPDFSSQYPNIELQMDWLTFYLEEYLNESLDQSDQRVAVLKDQVDMFVIASHLFWTLWSLVQTEISEINFDFLRLVIIFYSVLFFHFSYNIQILYTLRPNNIILLSLNCWVNIQFTFNLDLILILLIHLEYHSKE